MANCKKKGKSEKWKPIDGYSGKYLISRNGEVMSIIGNPKFLSPFVHVRGYVRFELRHEGKRKKELAHRLVAKAFLSNPHNHPLVCHKDDNTANNNVENLYWGTQKANLRQMYSRNRQRHDDNNKRFKPRDIALIRRSRLSIKKLMMKFGVTDRTIQKIRNGHTYENI